MLGLNPKQLILARLYGRVKTMNDAILKTEIKLGRPRKEIDRLTFEKLCALQCTLQEFCAWFDCDADTMNAFAKREYGMTFSEAFKLKRSVGQTSLRRTQWKQAQKYWQMSKFLGQNYLGQSEKASIEHTGTFEHVNILLDGQPI